MTDKKQDPFIYDIPNDMLSFWRVGCMLCTIDEISDTRYKEIKRDYGYEKEYVNRLHAWVKKLPQSVIDECLIEPRFDAFCTYLTKMLLRDVTKIALVNLKEKISKLEDANALASTATSLSRRVGELNKQYEAELNTVRGGAGDRSIANLADYKPARHG